MLGIRKDIHAYNFYSHPSRGPQQIKGYLTDVRGFLQNDDITIILSRPQPKGAISKVDRHVSELCVNAYL